jgi:hypothetical protein
MAIRAVLTFFMTAGLASSLLQLLGVILKEVEFKDFPLTLSSIPQSSASL